MNLKQFDNRRVQITAWDGNVFEGICEHNSRDYNEHEFGRREDGLQIANFLFFRRDIRAIRELAAYSAPWGTIEE